MKSPFQTTVPLILSRGTVTAIRPTRAEIDALQVGDMAPDSFGKLAEVANIFARGDDIHGKRYVCYETYFGTPNADGRRATCSMSQKEGEISRDVQTCRFGTSAEITAHDLR